MWLDRNLNLHDPIARGWSGHKSSPIATSPLGSRRPYHPTSAKCPEETCPFYIYGFAETLNRDAHVRDQHRIPIKRDSGLSLGSASSPGGSLLQPPTPAPTQFPYAAVSPQYRDRDERRSQSQSQSHIPSRTQAPIQNEPANSGAAPDIEPDAHPDHLFTNGVGLGVISPDKPPSVLPPRIAPIHTLLSLLHPQELQLAPIYNHSPHPQSNPSRQHPPSLPSSPVGVRSNTADHGTSRSPGSRKRKEPAFRSSPRSFDLHNSLRLSESTTTVPSDNPRPSYADLDVAAHESILPPLKRSRVGPSRLESINELHLQLSPKIPCLRCRLADVKVSFFFLVFFSSVRVAWRMYSVLMHCDCFNYQGHDFIPIHCAY